MRVIKTAEVSRKQSTHPIFTGGNVSFQPLITKEMGKNFNIITVYFSQGARTKLHVHTSDQALMVTGGMGIVGTGGEETVVRTGDLILIPAGEKHWHGATENSEFSHISVLTADSQETILEN